MKNNIGVVIPYFGKLPGYFAFFVGSCLKNRFIDFLIFTDDASALQYAGNNVYVHCISRDSFNKLASEKFGAQFELKSGYKICDLKPAIGHLFEDYIESYTFWGFCDIDLVLGDLSSVLKPETLANNDIISFYDLFISGPFCLFRNNKEVNRLYTQSKDYKVVFENKHYSFCEAGGIDVVWQLWKGVPILSAQAPIESFSHVVLNPSKCNLRLSFNLIIEDRDLRGDTVSHKNDKLFLNGKEIALYHFIAAKSRLTFNTPPYRSNKDFTFTQNGFFYDSLKSRTVDWLLSLSSNFRSKAIKRVKSKISFLHKIEGNNPKKILPGVASTLL
jgi:hypothetical protein